MGEMLQEYQDMLDDGTYDNEEDLCNGEGVNYDDIYEDDEYEED